MNLNVPIPRSLGSALVVCALIPGFCLAATQARQAPTAAQKQNPGTTAVNLTAKSANVSEPGTGVRISIFRWSSDEERSAMLLAMDPAAQAAAQAGRGGGARGGRGGAGGGRGARGAAPVEDPAAADDDADNLGAAAPAARGGRGGGRGGRGGGDAAAPSAPPDPIVSLTAAIGKAPSIGYIWTNEVVGYSIKYAYHTPSPDGGERIVLATERRLGGYTPAWRLAGAAAAAAPDYDFTLVEIRLDAKGLGEGKTSLTTKVVTDNAAKTLALDNYAAAPTVLQNVKR